VRIEDVESFAARFVSVRSIEERFNTRSLPVAEYLKQNGKEVLAIHLPGKGKNYSPPKDLCRKSRFHARYALKGAELLNARRRHILGPTRHQGLAVDVSYVASTFSK
jgi:hypothetical protein